MSLLRNPMLGAALLLLGTVLIGAVVWLNAGPLAIGVGVVATAAMIAGTLMLGTSEGGRPV
ncbi:hypothetical protein ACFO0N_11735 [Halobium salinum]|uniref:Uncharacterized protein n=1 Tax=Halobium salinum TaxID=1364940 RepID=A0ABD5PDS0_9EURY|nr:hypothetical protein [Halobium salinum]